MMCGKGSNYNEVDINLREYTAYYYWKYDLSVSVALILNKRKLR